MEMESHVACEMYPEPDCMGPGAVPLIVQARNQKRDIVSLRVGPRSPDAHEDEDHRLI